jgi:preprotein translocase subunit SecF
MPDAKKPIRIKEADKIHGIHFWLVLIVALIIIISGWFFTVRKVVVNDFKNVGVEIKYSASSIKSDIDTVKKTIKPLDVDTTHIKSAFDNVVNVFNLTKESHQVIIEKVKEKIEIEEKNNVQYVEEETTKQ